MDILALDFDGVICDSAGEAAITGWKGAARLWPRRFAGDAPDEIVKKFRQVRPVMETGFESILLARLLRDGCPVSKILEDATALFSGLMRDEGITQDELVPVFGQTRDTWIADDLHGWLDMHDFYEGTVEALNQSEIPVYIITTKEKRFARSLCHHAALRIPEENIFGLESGKKQLVLTTLSRRHEKACFHFLEDRLETLISMINGFDFDTRLYFARWGYHTVDQCDKAHTFPEIKVLTQDQFPGFVKKPSHFRL
jgi:phosphoglycolate phosphatase-like HAD superfamily hydrolase